MFAAVLVAARAPALVPVRVSVPVLGLVLGSAKALVLAQGSETGLVKARVKGSEWAALTELL